MKIIMKRLFKCELCGLTFDIEEGARECELRHLNSFIKDLNTYAEIAKQHNLTFTKDYNPMRDEYMWALTKLVE